MLRLAKDVMRKSPLRLDCAASVTHAAHLLRSSDASSVLVEDDGRLLGILTERDIALRVVAQSRDPNITQVGEVCTLNPLVITGDDQVEWALELMRQRAVRRLPVVNAVGHAIGLVSWGDVTLEVVRLHG